MVQPTHRNQLYHQKEQNLLRKSVPKYHLHDQFQDVQGDLIGFGLAKQKSDKGHISFCISQSRYAFAVTAPGIVPTAV